MVELFPPRRRAEHFARALEGDVRSPDPRLQELLDVVSQLAAVPIVEPRAQFRDALRTRLLEVAAEELPAQAAARERATAAPQPVVDDARAARRRRRLVAAATGLVLVGGGTGVAAASEQALPGDVLYPVKRTIETFQVTLAQGADAEGRALLERASTRLEEADALSSRIAAATEVPDGDLQAVRTALDDFASDASTGGDRMLDAYDVSGDPADVRVLRDFTADSHQVLADLARTLPPQVQPLVMAADETVVVLDNMAMQACPECTSGPALPGLPTQPVVLPRLGPDASAHPPGTNPQPGERTRERRDRRADDDTRRSGRQRSDGDPSTRRSAPADNAPGLPGVELGGPAQQHGDDAAPGTGGATSPQRQPRVDLGDVVDDPVPLSPPPPPGTDGPDLGDVTEPLTEPLDPLAERRRSSGDEDAQDRTRERRSPLRDTLDGTGETLDGLL